MEKTKKCCYIAELEKELAEIQAVPFCERGDKEHEREDEICFLLNRRTFEHICVLHQIEEGERKLVKIK